MNRISFADALETASEQVGTAVDNEIATLLRNAAIKIRNSNTIALDATVDFSLAELAMEFGIPKDQLIRNILKEWVESNYLPLSLEDDEESPTGQAISQRRH